MVSSTADCKFLTYYYRGGFPAGEVCILFSSCERVNPCQACVSETQNCAKRCEQNYLGLLDDNILEAVTDVASESDCWYLCTDQQACTFYTYFQSSHPVFPSLCFLLARQQGPYHNCQDCLTGPASCDGQFSSLCGLAVGGEGEFRQAILLTNTSVEHSLQLVGYGQCLLRVLAVGGGGRGGFNYHSSAAGGGSGFLALYSDYISPGVTDLTITVGDQAEGSELVANGRVLLEAAHGQHGFAGIKGGNGYCGGGDRFPRPSRGGTDGSDGEGDGQEGYGTGEDLSSFHFNNFVLSPGPGGFRDGSGGGGGGGGGVLVNSGGPRAEHEGTGQGYGGGGEGSYDPAFTFHGLQGVVIIELDPQ